MAARLNSSARPNAALRSFDNTASTKCPVGLAVSIHARIVSSVDGGIAASAVERFTSSPRFEGRIPSVGARARAFVSCSWECAWVAYRGRAVRTRRVVRLAVGASFHHQEPKRAHSGDEQPVESTPPQLFACHSVNWSRSTIRLYPCAANVSSAARLVWAPADRHVPNDGARPFPSCRGIPLASSRS